MYLQVNNEVTALLKRSPKRKTIGIKVQNGKVQVSAPTQTNLADIESFVAQKQAWIERHLRKQIALQNVEELPQYQGGERVFFKGQPITLQLTESGVTRLLESTLLLANEYNDRNSRAIELANWYIDQAAEDLPIRVENWSRRMGVAPATIKIRHYKTRWGSCDRKGGVQFNWLILMAPEHVIDYVVVHELAHLVYFNHSKEFWNLVEVTLPHYKTSRAWLKQQSHLQWQLDN